MDFELCRQIVANMSRVVVGKADSLELMMVALLADGHVLLEDVPGVGKTVMAKALARSIGGRFKRVQFTPDLLPSDITGFNVYNQQSGAFQFQSGPVMTHILLADEINRTIPRTQASLLESMDERQVTVDGQTMALPAPFFVMATQNPIELEGTFPLPEAQLDRFLLRLRLGYPDQDEETAILARFQKSDPLPELTAVAGTAQIAELQRKCRQVRVSEPIRRYIAAVVAATRVHDALRFGVSPRGSLALMRAGQALAALRGRDYVLPDDIKHMAGPVLTHRLILKDVEQLRGASGDRIVAEVLDRTTVPISSE